MMHLRAQLSKYRGRGKENAPTNSTMDNGNTTQSQLLLQLLNLPRLPSKLGLHLGHEISKCHPLSFIIIVFSHNMQINFTKPI